MVIAMHDIHQLAPSISKAEDPLLTFKEAMAYLRVSRSTLYRLIWSGQLTGHKVGSTWRFKRSDVVASLRAVAASDETAVFL